ncbi:unnamed protein product [Polarella glacialis]|uniref:Uncharacterized protein n=1 Tax=Polarella glacialis TaxID=89957 RepID=A0A813LZ56_POLGL|nr:unnamed protein product [Polarella glacialis]
MWSGRLAMVGKMCFTTKSVTGHDQSYGETPKHAIWHLEEHFAPCRHTMVNIVKESCEQDASSASSVSSKRAEIYQYQVGCANSSLHRVRRPSFTRTESLLGYAICGAATFVRGKCVAEVSRTGLPGPLRC